MEDLKVKISELPLETSPSLAHMLHASKAGASTSVSVQQIANLITAIIVNGAPETLDTLNEIAAAINDDDDFAAIVIANLATKLALSGGVMSGAITLSGDPTETLHAVTKGYVDGLSGLGKNTYVSPPQSISDGGSFTLTHGLGETPKLIVPWLLCNVASAGFTIGDTFPIGVMAKPGGAADYGVLCVPDSTEIFVRFAGAGLAVLNKSTGVAAPIDESSFSLIIKAWA